MEIKNPEKRLKQFWGRVDKKHIDIISKHIKGKTVLDMGCGLGTTTRYLTDAGYACTGIDYDEQSIAYCQKTYPHCNYIQANAEELPFEDAHFDTIILRDALHHFYGEANFEKVKREILRVAKPQSVIIFFDPNINFMLKTMRWLSAHNDEECKYEDALAILNDMGYALSHSSFNTLCSLPLSGGYVGINFTPNIGFVQNSMLYKEKLFERFFNKIGLGRYLCWRYLIVGQLA